MSDTTLHQVGNVAWNYDGHTVSLRTQDGHAQRIGLDPFALSQFLQFARAIQPPAAE